MYLNELIVCRAPYRVQSRGDVDWCLLQDTTEMTVSLYFWESQGELGFAVVPHH